MEQNKSGVGSIIGTVIIIAIIILGGLYFWGKRVEESKLKESLVAGTQDTTAANSETAMIKNVSPSDNITSIQADLSATNLNNLTAEVNTP